MKLFASVKRRIHSNDKALSGPQDIVTAKTPSSAIKGSVKADSTVFPSDSSASAVPTQTVLIDPEISAELSGRETAQLPKPTSSNLRKIYRQPSTPGANDRRCEPDSTSSAQNEASINCVSGNFKRPSDEDTPFPELPTLSETPLSERKALFKKKLEACTVVFDFKKNTSNVKEKETKRQTLLEIVEYVNTTRDCFSETTMEEAVKMVSRNIFRALPPTAVKSTIVFEPEEEEPALESSWPHLQIVYEFFLRFVVSNDVDPKIAKRFIDQHFVLKLLELFNSEDPRERDYLKTILHRIYGKIMALRAFIRKSIQHVFFKFIFEVEIHNGISELLEILGSIINGFALPMKDEHKIFLEKALIPLHKTRSLSAFHQQLSYCMTQYVEKDCHLAETIILGMLRYWPATNTSKEVLFLNELEEILELTQLAEFQKVMVPLFRTMASCIQSPHFQVAERVLFLWNNDCIVKLINQNKQVLFPIILSALYRNSREHWNGTVHGLTYNVSKLLAEADSKLFDECSDINLAAEEKRVATEEDRQKKWTDLQMRFERHAPF